MNYFVIIFLHSTSLHC